MKSKILSIALIGCGLIALVAIMAFCWNGGEDAPEARLTGYTSIVDDAASEANGLANIVFFEAEQIGQETMLVWEAVDELELVGYQVERSCGNEPFKRIGWVYSRELSRELTYDFIDKEPHLKGACFYRLKMVDFDGTWNFSPVVNVPDVTF